LLLFYYGVKGLAHLNASGPRARRIPLRMTSSEYGVVLSILSKASIPFT
jgi:hypothetical protein